MSTLTSILIDWINVMDWLTAGEALALLGTQPQTLYANVSRGRIIAKRDPKDSRKSLYRGDDVRRLAKRSGGRRSQQTVAAESMRYGEPVLPTSISTISQGRLLYRGKDAVEWSKTADLEDTAALLWNCEQVDFQLRPSGQGSIAKAFTVLGLRAAADLPTFGRNPLVLSEEAQGVFAALASGFLDEGGFHGQVHEALAQVWHRPEAADVIRRALVLLADHELNASTFAARVTVSTGASLSAAALAGLSALTGPLHGGASIGAVKLGREAAEFGAEAAILARLGQGLALPAFGHPLYPHGDPRARALLDAFELPQPFIDLRRAASRITGEEPNVDFALAAAAWTFNLPKDAPFTLFAIGRCVGWLAHAVEQTTQGQLIRPRGYPQSGEAGK